MGDSSSTSFMPLLKLIIVLFIQIINVTHYTQKLFVAQWSSERRTKFSIYHGVERNNERLSDLYTQNICHDAKGWKGWNDQLVRVFHFLMILSGTYSPFLSHSFFCLPLPRRRNPRYMDKERPAENTWPHFHVSQWSNRLGHREWGSEGFKNGPHFARSLALFLLL